MGNIKRCTKKILSIIIMITIIINLMPNFGLLTNISNATDLSSGIILRLDTEKGMWTDEYGEYNAISLDILVKDMDVTSFVLPIKFNTEKLTPAYYYVGKRDEYIDIATNAKDFTSDMNGEIPTTFNATNQPTDTDWSKVNDGKIILEFLDSRGETINFKDETLICTISFIVDTSITDVNEISTDMINIDKDSNSFEIFNFLKEEYKVDVNTYFSLQGINILPTVQSLSIKTDPTQGKTYLPDEEIDLTDGELTATYTDGSTKDISMKDENVTVKTGEKVGAFADIDNPKLTFEYENCTVDLDITVVDTVEKIEFYDKENRINSAYLTDGDPIPSKNLYIKAITKSGKVEEIRLDDSRISLDSAIADIEKVPESERKDCGGGLYSGIQKIGLTYTDTYVTKTTDFNILVNDRVASIEVSTANPPKKEYIVNDNFAKTGAITVIGASGHNYGDIEMSSDNVIVTEMNGTEVTLSKLETDKELKVTYGGQSTSYKINVGNSVKSIRVDGTALGEYSKALTAANFQSVTITEIMADGTEGDTKDLDFSWVDTSSFNNTIATIQNLAVNYPYNGKAIEGLVKARVKDELLGIRVENLKDEYVYKDELDCEGAELYIQYVSGEFGVNVSDYDLSDPDSELRMTGFDSTKIENNQVLTFTYNDGEKEVTTTAQVNIGKATQEVPECGQLEIVEGKALSTIADSLPTTEYGDIIWKDGTQTLTYVEGAENIHEIDAIYKMNTANAPYYKDVDCKIKVKVLKRDVSKIEITTPPTNTEYVEGQYFNPAGMVITVNYNDGDTTLIASDYATKGVTFAPAIPLQTADTKVTVTYSGKTATQDITVVEKKVTSIAVTKGPTKASYVEGQALNLDGMEVTATYNDGDKQVTTDYTTNPTDGATLNTVGTQDITVTYTGTDAVAGIATASTSVEVVEKKVTSIAVTKGPTKASYVEGQALNLDGMEVTATYNDGDKQVTTDYTTNPTDGATLNTVGTQDITVTYTGTDAVAGIATASTSVEVVKKVVENIAVTTLPTKTSYVEGHPFEPAGMVVTAYYNDGTDALTTDYTISPSGDLTPENTTITVTYTGTDIAEDASAPTADVAITVSERQVESIKITKAPANVNYIEGQDFNPTGMEVTVTYNNHEKPLVISSDYDKKDITFAPSTGLHSTDNKIVVSYRGFTDNQAITVIPDSVTDITFTFNGETTYNYGDPIDLKTSTITKVWASGLTHTNDTIPMTLDMLSNSDITNFDNMNSLGTKQITVTYGAVVKSNAFQIEIKDYINAIEIEDKTKLQEEYEYGDTINVTDKDTGADLYILAKYAGGTPDKRVKLTTDMVSGFNMSKVGPHTVTVTYVGKTDTFEINVRDKVIGIDITKEPAKKVYKLNETVNFSDIVIKNVMASGDEGTILTVSDYEISAVDTSLVGEKTVTVTKKGTSYTDTFKIKVIDATTGMTITSLPKQTYNYGEELNLARGKITVKTQQNTTGTEIAMTNTAVAVTGYNPNKLGDQVLTVTYTYEEETNDGMVTKVLTDTYTVNVEDYATGIVITKKPSKLTYEYGESLELAGGKVAEKMASGATRNEVDITGEMVSGYNKATVGTQVITVSYLGKTDMFNITVVDSTLGISMKTLPEKTQYTQGDAIDVSGAVLNVTKSSGIKEIPVTKEMISGYDPNKVGTQIVTVSYDGLTAEFVVSVKAKTTDKPVNPSKPTTPIKPNKPTTPSKPSTSETVKYTVTFIDYDGEILKTEVVESGKSATAPVAKERAGYRFLGWDKEFDVVEEDMTIMAKYEEVVTAKVNVPGVIKVEKGKDLDLSNVTMDIFDDEGNKIDEIPVTLDMISGYNPDKIGTQTVTITYTDESGVEYTATFRVKVEKPVETLGVKDEVVEKEENDIKDTLVPAIIGIGVSGLLLLLIAAITKKNVEIYAVSEEGRKLIGKERISKKNTTILLEQYKSKISENEKIEVEINDKTVEKLKDEQLQIVVNNKTQKSKIKSVIKVK